MVKQTPLMASNEVLPAPNFEIIEQKNTQDNK